jgi:hypothetical protein
MRRCVADTLGEALSPSVETVALFREILRCKGCRGTAAADTGGVGARGGGCVRSGGARGGGARGGGARGGRGARSGGRGGAIEGPAEALLLGPTMTAVL